jgi:hypothetical protein
MKISWGHKIAGAYILFVAGIVFLVLKANSERFDLVTKDYYGEELKYQQVIDQAANANALSMPVRAEKSNNELLIRFPDEMAGKKIDGEVYLYYPADAAKDFRQSFIINGLELRQALPVGIRGKYELKLSWLADGKKYYHEKKIFF